MGAWHEDRLANWTSVVAWLWLDFDFDFDMGCSVIEVGLPRDQTVWMSPSSKLKTETDPVSETVSGYIG
jgi:hypothetical protein